MNDESAVRPGDVVEMTVPASPAYAGLVRTLAAGLATRLDLDLDHIEDLRLAMSEACAVVLADTPPGVVLTVRLEVGRHDLTAWVSAPTTAAEPPGTDSFAWTVLRALADDADGSVEEGTVVIRLRFTAPDDSELFGRVSGADLS